MCMLYTISGPDAPPQNVNTTAVSSTEIVVSWEEVPAIDQNGVITIYEIQFEPLVTFEGQISTNSVNVTNTSLFVILTGLEEYVEYNISVRAYTSAGPGPYSDGVVERTNTDGMWNNMTFWGVLMFKPLLYSTSCTSSECNSHCCVLY